MVVFQTHTDCDKRAPNHTTVVENPISGFFWRSGTVRKARKPQKSIAELNPKLLHTLSPSYLSTS
eukprot:m.254014 g.254014  ORF g.254014 m.254014 type:complete len:65 (+) comp15937_c0_seq7:4779-4973(+)